YVTFFVMLIVIAFFVYLLLSSSGSYLSAWYLSLVFAVLLLYLISFPRYIKLTTNMLEIHAILEITPIIYSDIKRVYRIKRYRLKGILPLIGSYGFGGFFGYYIDVKQLKIVYMHATKLSNLIAIEDIYNDKYIISCEDPVLFIEELKAAKERNKKL
ncbi:MAG: PH domain-containing protein, partial [Rikenellaceae bacterium]